MAMNEPNLSRPSLADSRKRKITLAGYDYDRVYALIDGRVQVEGCDTRFELSRRRAQDWHVGAGKPV